MTKTLIRAVSIATTALLGANAFAQQPPAAAPVEAAMAAPGEVATVESTNGRVLLNRAATYKPAVNGERLLPGDRLVVLDGGSLGVRYDKGCVQAIATPNVYTVNSMQTCDAAATDRGLRAAPPTATGTGWTSADYMRWGLVGLGIAAPIYIIATNTQGGPVSP